MAKETKGPLTEAHLRLLNKLIEACKETERYCQMCEECHLAVEPERRKNREQMDIASRIKARFFPTAK